MERRIARNAKIKQGQKRTIGWKRERERQNKTEKGEMRETREKKRKE